MSCASNPYTVVGSSMVPVTSDSNTRLKRPGGAEPFNVNGLYLSKLELRVAGTSLSSPPFGAFGFTHSKLAKPAGYLGMLPNDSAWTANAACGWPKASSRHASAQARPRIDESGMARV